MTDGGPRPDSEAPAGGAVRVPDAIVRSMKSIWERYRSTRSGEDLRELATYLPHFVGDPMEHTSVLMTIVRECFVRGGVLGGEWCEQLKHDLLAPSYFDVVRSLRATDGFVRAIRSRLPPRAPGSPPRIVATAPQILGIRHSPSAVMFEYAKALTGDGRAQVMLLNSDSLPPAPGRTLDDSFVATPSPYGAGVQRLKYGSGELFLYTEKSRGVSQHRTMVGLYAALLFDPDLVISLGGYHHLADLLAHHVPSICMPADRTQPVSCAHVHIDYARYWDRIELAERGHLRCAPLVRTLSDKIPAPPPARVIERSELGCAEDDFIFVVVGTRLEVEMDAPFESLLENLLRRERRARILVVGITTHRWTQPGMVELASRVSFIRFERDLNALFRACDCMLNPRREGAGFTAVIAMDASLPVLTLSRCCVAAVIGEKHARKDWASLEAEALEMIADPAHHGAWRRRMKDALDAEDDMGQTAERILEIGVEAREHFRAHGPLLA